jgi:hypothetical protein
MSGRDQAATGDIMAYTNHTITGDASFTGGDHWHYTDYEGGLNMGFIGTSGDLVSAHGSGSTITGTGNTNLIVDLHGFNGRAATGDHLSFDLIRGGMTIIDFNRTDTLTLTNEGVGATAAEAFRSMTSDGHCGQLLPIAGGGSIHFLNSHFTAANLAVVITHA